jgi:hypothetical protein
MPWKPIRLSTSAFALLALTGLVAQARPGDKPFPAEQRLADYTVTDGFGSTSLILTFEGKVIAEVFTEGHEFPDKVDDQVVETLAPADLAAVANEAKVAAGGTPVPAPDQFDWSPVSGGAYHVVSANAHSTLLKRWGGRVAGYAKANPTPEAAQLETLLEGLYQKAFSNP